MIDQNEWQITIVVPIYNAEEYVEATLRSLLDSETKGLKIIAINDGSTDLSREVVKRVSSTEAGLTMTFLETENQGQAKALNFGWAQASSPYIGYLSADDVIYKGWYNQAIEFLNNNPLVVMVYPNYDLIDSKGQVVRKVVTSDYNPEDMIEKLLCHAGPGAVFRREAFEKTMGWKTKLRQIPDFDFWLRLSRFGDFKRLPVCGAGYRVHAGSLSYGKPPFSNAEEPVAVMTDFFEQADLGPATLKKKSLALAQAHLLSARLHGRGLRFLPFLKHSLKSFEYSPKTFFSLSSLKLLLSGWLGRLTFSMRRLFLKKMT